MKKNFLKCLLLSCSVMVLLNACVKDKYTGNQTGDAGPSYVRITEAKVYNQFFSPFTTVKPVTMFSVRRDAASSTVLQGTNTVVLTDITTAYLAAHSTPYSAMPSTLYTVASAPGVTASATSLTFTFGPGDFAKNVVFNIDGSKVDLSKQYAIAYAVTNTGGLTQKAGLDTILATIAIKNKYDGVYTISGTMVDITNPAFAEVNTLSTLVGVTPYQYELRTTSANTCDVYDNYSAGYAQGYGIVFNTGTGASAYGSFMPVLTFNLANDKITAVTNHYGQPAGNGRYAQLDPSGTVNAYENGKITIKYNMVGGALVSANQVRTTWDEVWTYKKSR
ncbi:hypothetical protein BEL04_11410 [Mucilaginibacter sp. PPCGB 2223]|uniref:hypothetical protein n=1 Tax=Mucilaginibacter sp. PPCGB 2223 TaxID=1886027 RepID=UPI0008256402|nr:hypothetical protein [Mucilaginibacter sp. PPCGB 2223]OCX52099.1 hypothetical protein BEL04_11410 [Mucilaginibacter sp. PPCGB 2223]